MYLETLVLMFDFQFIVICMFYSRDVAERLRQGASRAGEVRFPMMHLWRFLSRAFAAAQSILPLASLLSSSCQGAVRVVVVNNGGIGGWIIVSR